MVSWQVPIFLLSVGRNGCLLRCSCSTSKFPEQLSIKLVGSEATSRGYQQNLSLYHWSAERLLEGPGGTTASSNIHTNWESWNPTLGPCTCQKLQPHNGYTLRTMGFNAISLHAPTLKPRPTEDLLSLLTTMHFCVDDHEIFLGAWHLRILRCQS